MRGFLRDEVARDGAPVEFVVAPGDAEAGCVGHDGVARVDRHPAGGHAVELRDVFHPRRSRRGAAERHVQLHQEVRAHREIEGLGQVRHLEPRRDATDARHVDLHDRARPLLHVGHELRRLVERLADRDRHRARRGQLRMARQVVGRQRLLEPGDAELGVLRRTPQRLAEREALVGVDHDLEAVAHRGTPQAFAADPKLVWEWYNWRREVHSQCKPNPGHWALVELERRAPQFTLITQNVDKLHEEAGSSNVLHLHGSLWRVRCLRCEKEEHNSQVPLVLLPPICDCGGMLRPAVVWFGESLPQYELRKAVDTVQGADVLLVVGTSAMVQPAASLPRMALACGARVIEVNPEETELSASASIFMKGKAGEVLPRLV